MLTAYETRGCTISLKVHFLFSYLEYFPHILGPLSDEQLEGFHQNLRMIEKRYQGKIYVNMMSDYFWIMKRDNVYRKSFKRSGISIKINKKMIFYD